jgi:hypothetical protein
MQYSVSVETWEQVRLLDVGQGLSKCVMRNDVLRPAAGRVVVLCSGCSPTMGTRLSMASVQVQVQGEPVERMRGEQQQR